MSPWLQGHTPRPGRGRRRRRRRRSEEASVASAWATNAATPHLDHGPQRRPQPNPTQLNPIQPPPPRRTEDKSPKKLAPQTEEEFNAADGRRGNLQAVGENVIDFDVALDNLRMVMPLLAASAATKEDELPDETLLYMSRVGMVGAGKVNPATRGSKASKSTMDEDAFVVDGRGRSYTCEEEYEETSASGPVGGASPPPLPSTPPPPPGSKLASRNDDDT